MVAKKISCTHKDKLELIYIEASMSKSEEILEVHVAMNKAAHLLDPSLASNEKLRSGNSRGGDDQKVTPVSKLSLTNQRHTLLINNSQSPYKTLSIMDLKKKKHIHRKEVVWALSRLMSTYYKPSPSFYWSLGM